MYHWVTDRNCYRRKQLCIVSLQRDKVDKHPLEKSSVITSKLKSNSIPLDELDPLSLQEMDPLSRMAVDNEYVSSGIRSSKDTFEPWSVKKNSILNKFTTQEKLSITTSIYTSENSEIRAVSEKVLHRLEQLDLDTGSKQFFGGLSQEEYALKISQLDQQLSQAWQSDLRVDALKISIQCCKLLDDTSVIYFYPSKFVMFTDILDKFGNMVYSRLRAKQSDMLSAEVAKETCKNWFFKVGSIRELLPRITIELAILKSYSFITLSPDYGKILHRLLRSMWGIGDPVVSIYMRCYLCRVAMELIPDHKELYMQCFQDLLLLHDQVLDNFRNCPQLAEAKVTMEVYVSVLSPAVEWILQCLVHRGEHLHYTLQLISTIPAFWRSVLLSAVLRTFPPSYIAEECVNILEMILSLETNLAVILKNLGTCLLVAEPPQDQGKQIWETVFPQIKKLHNRDEYLSCCQVWVEFMVKNFGSDMIQDFLEDLLYHVPHKDCSLLHGKLMSIVEKLLNYSNSITMLLYMTKFVKLVTMLNTSAVRAVLTSFVSKHQEPQGDSLLVNTLMHLASTLHDSVDALTPIDEEKQIGGIINGFILRVNFGRDFEKQLQFYDEARGAFTNIDIVLVQLVQCVCRLGMEVRTVVGGHHTKRTRGFLSACIAYCFITIPSWESTYSQMQLYLITAQVAYANQCISQGDACLKASIMLMSENWSDIDCGEQILHEYISNLLSTLLAVPDHPKEAILYLLKGLMRLEWDSPTLSLKMLSLLGAYAQENYPYGFEGVDANNKLYGGDEMFLGEIDAIGSTILNGILKKIKFYGEENHLKKQGTASLDLFVEIINWCDLAELSGLALNLWNLAKKNCDYKLATRTFEYIRRKSNFRNDLQTLVSKMTIN